MSDPVEIAVIGALLAAFQGALAFFGKLRQDKHAQDNKDQLDIIHRDVNGKVETLLQVSGAAERAKGNLEGRAEQKAGI